MPGTRYVTIDTLPTRTGRWLAACHAEPARRRPLPSLASAALLVLDLQRYFADPASHAYVPALEAVLPTVQRLIEAFRRTGRPVIFTRHGTAPEARGSTQMRRWWRDELRLDEPRAALLPELTPLPAEPVLEKAHYSAFHETTLPALLADRACDTVVIAGVLTHLCCETTARDAFLRDLQPVVVADACATSTEELHVGALRGLAHGFAVVEDAEAVLAGLPGGRATPGVRGPARRARRLGPRDLIVVGGGPAGLAAAIQARREGLDVLVLEGSPALGGLARTANLIENYPGFPGGIPGRAFTERLLAQVELHDVEAETDAEVTAVRRAPVGALEVVVRGQARPRSARAVLVATGTSPRPLPAVAGLADDAAVVRGRLDAAGSLHGRRVLIVGGGEAALDQALLARRLGASSVQVVVRRDRLRAMELLVRRARDERVEITTGAVLAAAARPVPGGPLRATVDVLAPRGRREVEVDLIAVCTGREPSGPALPAPLGTILTATADLDGATAVPGLYLAGDVRRGASRQVGIAVGDGLAAAMHAVRHLRRPPP